MKHFKSFKSRISKVERHTSIPAFTTVSLPNDSPTGTTEPALLSSVARPLSESLPSFSAHPSLRESESLSTPISSPEDSLRTLTSQSISSSPGTTVIASENTDSVVIGTSPTKTAWEAFKSILSIVEKVSVVFPPLQGAVGGLNGIISLVETSSSNMEKLEEISRTLNLLQETISRYPQNLDFKQIKRLELITGVFDDARATVEAQQEKGRLSRIAGGADDQTKLITTLSKLHQFVNLLQLDVSFTTEASVIDIREQELLKLLDRVLHASFETLKYSDLRVGCTPGTRESVLKGVHDWAFDPEGKPLFWLNGMAGTGKTTIAESLCKSLEAFNILGGSFFCSRTAGGRQDARRIFPTVAFQLAHRVEGFRHRLCRQLEKPDIVEQQVAGQFSQLIWEPLQATMNVSNSSKGIPLIVVIDALDECPDKASVTALLHTLTAGTKETPSPLRFLLISRSDPHIAVPIRRSILQFSTLQLHAIPRPQVNKDIRQYVEADLREMCERNGWDDHWYQQEDVDFIVSQADVLFIYAATAMKYLAGSPGHPRHRLRLIREATSVNKPKMADPLHLLYAKILNNLGESDVLEPTEVHAIKGILFMLSCSHTSLRVPDIADLLDVHIDEVRAYLRSLSSIALVPTEPEEHLQPVQLLHASFAEFLLSTSHHLPLHLRLDTGLHHRDLMLRCLGILKENLKDKVFGEDIYRQGSLRGITLRWHYATSERVSVRVSPVVRYASQYWMMHMSDSIFDDTAKEIVASTLHNFVGVYLLRWLECIGWLQSLSQVQHQLKQPATLQTLSGLSREIGHTFGDLSKLLSQNVDFVENYPLEIYHSTSVWLPKLICEPLAPGKQKKNSFPPLTRSLPDAWLAPALGQRRTSKKHIVDSLVTFPNIPYARWLSRPQGPSPEIVVHEWDTQTNSETQISLSVSPNAVLRLASNGIFSYDPLTVELTFVPLLSSPLSMDEESTWNMEIGGLAGSIFDVAASPHGDRVAVWNQKLSELYLVDAQARAYRRIPVHGVSSTSSGCLFFSPDATLLGLYNPEDSSEGIRVFKTDTGDLQYTIEGPLSRRLRVHFTSFSPDNRVLVTHFSKGTQQQTSPDFHVQVLHSSETGQEHSSKGNLPFLMLNNEHGHSTMCSENVKGWELSTIDTDSSGYLGIPMNRGREHPFKVQRIFEQGREEICWIPNKYKKSGYYHAQMGGTHLFLSSAERGVIVLKIPPRRFDAF